MKKGKFITLEGSEGAGKSTSLALVQQLLVEAGLPLDVTREPGGTPLGEELRSILLDRRHTGMSDDAELLLMFAARAEHLQRRILPALQQGRWVLCDRFTDATLAYQGGGRGIELARIHQLAHWVQGDMRPDLTLLLDLPVELGLQRAGRRSGPDRIESESIAFFERVRNTYLSLAQADPERFRIIDSSRPIGEVQAQIRSVIGELLRNDA